jgi:hypothetical protein
LQQQQQQQHGQAIIKAWRAADVVRQLDEGSVVIAVGLAAGSDGRSSTVDLGGLARPMLELSTTNKTRCVGALLRSCSAVGGEVFKVC